MSYILEKQKIYVYYIISIISIKIYVYYIMIDQWRRDFKNLSSSTSKVRGTIFLRRLTRVKPRCTCISFCFFPFSSLWKPSLKERNGEPAVQRSEIFWTGGGWNNEGSFSIDECIFLSFFSFVARNNFVKSQKVWVTVRSFFFFLSSFIECGDAYTVIKKK